MHALKWAPVLVLFPTAGAANAASKIEFILETGRDNHAELYEAGQWPPFTPGVTDGSTTVEQGQDLTWDVRVLAHGPYNEVNPGDNLHEGLDPVTGDPGPGHGKYPLGTAHIVFDLVLKDDQGHVVQVGHGGPCLAGFHSTINEGDADGVRGQGGLNPDPLENAAFTSVFDIHGNGINGGRLIDPPSAGGPNMDDFVYPSAAGPPFDSVTPLGFLEGFEAGYRDFDFSVNYIPGVGMAGPLGPPENGCGVGLVPFDGQGHPLPPPLFEGQINTTGLPIGFYALEVIAEPVGNNILHGDINCAEQTFGAASFATRVNEVVVSSIPFTIEECSNCVPVSVVGRYLFYNSSYYDGNKAGIDAGPNGGTNHDHDEDAIDPSKHPLRPGDGLAQPANWTGCIYGIRGLMFDIANASGPISPADFTFTSLGKRGLSNTPVTLSGFLVRPRQGVNGSDRVVMTFPTGLLADTWLRVAIGTGFGLAEPDICWWGNARGDTGTPVGEYILVNVTDVLGIRDNQRPSPINRPLVDDSYDIVKNGMVAITDLLFARDNQTNPFNGVWRITR